MNNSTKASLITDICDTNRYTRQEVAVTLTALFDSMASALQRGQTIEIRGFGSLEPVNRAAKTARNPRTNDPVHVPPFVGVRFKAFQGLRKALNP